MTCWSANWLIEKIFWIKLMLSYVLEVLSISLSETSSCKTHQLVASCCKYGPANAYLQLVMYLIFASNGFGSGVGEFLRVSTWVGAQNPWYPPVMLQLCVVCGSEVDWVGSTQHHAILHLHAMVSFSILRKFRQKSTYQQKYLI